MTEDEPIFDWSKIDTLIRMQCTKGEIASEMGVTPDYLTERVKVERGVNWGTYFASKKASGVAKARKAHWKKWAEEGDYRALKDWLQNYGGLSEKSSKEVNVTGGHQIVVQLPDNGRVSLPDKLRSANPVPLEAPKAPKVRLPLPDIIKELQNGQDS